MILVIYVVVGTCITRCLHDRQVFEKGNKAQRRTSTDNLQLASKQSFWPRWLSSPAIISHFWSDHVLLFARYHFISRYSVFCVTLIRSRERSLMTKLKEKENRQIYLRWITAVFSGEQGCLYFIWTVRVTASVDAIWGRRARGHPGIQPRIATGKIKVSRRRTFSDVTSRINISGDGLVTEIRLS